METMSIAKKNNIQKLKNYYTKILTGTSPLTIVGLNDDRGFNLQKNILMYLKEYLTSENYSLQIVDCFSMFFNKTRHIDYFLNHNISLEEMKYMQEYGTENELEHALGFRPPFLNEFSRMFVRKMMTKLEIESIDPKNGLADIISSSILPIIVYASGINDLMYELHINPFNLKKSYQTREKDFKYDYALSRCNKTTVKKVIDGHRRNFETLLTLNENADIYVLSAFLYSKMNHIYEQDFREVILMYNDLLYQACQEYHVAYINSRILETTNQNNPIANYLSKKPPQILANEIIKEMVEKIERQEFHTRKPSFFPKQQEPSSLEILKELLNDIERTKQVSIENEGYLKQVASEQLEEHERELEVFKKVYQKVK